MRVIVKFNGPKLTHASLTIFPSWLGWLFGRRPRQAQIYYRDLGGPHLSSWLYEVDDDYVEADLEKIVKRARRWQEQHEIPQARSVSQRGRS